MSADVPYMPIREFEAGKLDESLYLNKNLDVTDDIVGDEDDDDDNDNDVTTKSSSTSNVYEGGDSSQYVRLLLEGMGMKKYISLFEEQHVGVRELIFLNADDLNALGITDDEDRKRIMSILNDFSQGDEVKKKLSYEELDREEDYVIIVRNVNAHLAEMNSFVSFLNYRLPKSDLVDYFVSNDLTALKVLNIVSKHALTQTNKITEMLFDGNFDGDKVIPLALKGQEKKIFNFVKARLSPFIIRKKIRKKRVFFTVLAAIGVVIGATLLKR